MNKQYAEKVQGLCQAWKSYALNGDDESARTVDQDVRSYMKDRGVNDYGEALRLRRSEVRALEIDLTGSPSTFEADPSAGEELDKIAQKNLQLDKTLNYGQALRLAILENPKLATKYVGYPVRTDGFEEVQKHFQKAQSEKRYEMSTASVIGNLVTGVPRLSDGAIDINAAVNAANAHPDAVRAACVDKLDVLLRDAINLEGIPASEVMQPSALATIRARVRTQHPDLARAADTGVINARGLRDLVPQLFK